MDSSAILDLISNKSKRRDHPDPIIRSIDGLINREWMIEFRHTFREGNRGADLLAKESLKCPPGFQFVDLPSPALQLILNDDCRGFLPPD
ncbi:hypothetical protein AHAS_Ahas05G0127700 [Arachis hypogaea]